MPEEPVPPTSLETARLVLRKPWVDDAEALFREHASDPEVTRFLTWAPHADPGETRAFLERCLDGWRDGPVYTYVIALRAPPEPPVGTIDLRLDAHGAAFGYALGRAQWGRGLMTEALTALVGWALEQPVIWRAYAYCDVQNRASARVMEKAGMTYEATLRRWLVHPNIGPEPRDCAFYAKVR